ncbi:unnamed protein product [Auanema sp. JU1783]|nr:unnamed protein product [Auanema sp. JU1783]
MSVVEQKIEDEPEQTDYLTWRDQNLTDKQSEMDELKDEQKQTFTRIFELQDQLAKESEDKTTIHSLKVRIANLSRKIAKIAVEMESTTLEMHVLNSVESFEIFEQAIPYLNRIRNAQLEIVNSSEVTD